MKLLEYFGLKSPAPPERKSTIDLAKHGVSTIFGAPVNSGVVVTTQTALQVTTALACVRLIAQGSASPSLLVMRGDGPGGRPVEAREAPEFDVLNRRPNRWQSSFEWREMMTAHAVLTGNAYSVIMRVGGRVDELLPLDPMAVHVEQLPDFSRVYRVTLPGGRFKVFNEADIFHLRGLTWDGIRGLNIVQAAREAIGLSAAAEGAQAKQLGNGAKPHGVLQTDQPLGDEVVDRIVSQWREATTGANQYKTPLLDSGVNFHAISLSAVDAQLVETRKHQIVEVCAAFGVAPAVLGIDDKTQAFASVESMQRWHLVNTLGPWLERWTQRLDLDVLDSEGPLFAKFDTRDMTKATLKERAEAYRSLAETGTFTRNELREWEGLPPLPGLDEPLTPMNMTGGGNEAGEA